VAVVLVVITVTVQAPAVPVEEVLVVVLALLCQQQEHQILVEAAVGPVGVLSFSTLQAVAMVAQVS
jgi:hypothetical protein